MIDTEALQKDVEDILVFSQDYPFDLNAKELILKWKSAKQDFINLFKGNTIVRSKNIVKIKLSEKQRGEKFDKFLETIEKTVAITDEFKQFLRDNKEGFFDNKVISPNEKHGIKTGVKLSKSFKQFLPELTTIRCIQDIASQFMQEDKIEGYLYLSIDPRDFLTISENNSNWSSCHTLDGEYRAGNLNYMVDETTIVAYLADEKQEHLKCLPADMVWNNKKWRMLIHTDRKNVIYYDRQYPYTSYELLNQAHEMLNSYFKGVFVPPNSYGFKTIISASGLRRLTAVNQIYIDNRIFDTRDIVNIKDYLGYCDIISSTTYTPILSLSENVYKELYIKVNEDRGYLEELLNTRALIGIKIGEEAPCVCCGKRMIHRDTSFLCPSCVAEHDADEDFFLTCNGCNHRIYDDPHWIKNKRGEELAYCNSCYHSMLKDNVIEE